MRIFQLFDADLDGCLNFEEFIRAVESFGRLYSSEDKYMCEWLSQLLQHQPSTLHCLSATTCLYHMRGDNSPCRCFAIDFTMHAICSFSMSELMTVFEVADRVQR